jgi:hypothetical protein
MAKASAGRTLIDIIREEALINDSDGTICVRCDRTAVVDVIGLSCSISWRQTGLSFWFAWTGFVARR